MNFTPLEQAVSQVLDAGMTPALQLAIRRHGRLIYSAAAGWLDPDSRRLVTTITTRFDMASVTKLFTTTCFMRLVEAGRVGLDQPVSTVLPAFSGLRPLHPYEDPLQEGVWVDVADEKTRQVDAGQTTFRQLLCHNSGLPAWRPFKEQPDAAAARQMALETFFSYLPGERIVYSDVGLILLGLAVEALTGQRLDEAIRQRVTQPLGLQHTGYLPIGAIPPEVDLGDVAPTEFCRWRNRRVIGEVHDESTSRLGGIAGHAGIFSTAEDIARFGQVFLDHGSPLLSGASVSEMVRVQAEYEGARRGLGFALWSADPEASSNPFSPATFGHTGFTGTSLWMDPERQLVVALLTNEVYNGRTSRAILGLRLAIHRAIVAMVEA
ncbi:MAG TPA: serine hydrolase domain-containing protein [Anaerolineaceae bacterium]|jgi:CubicO group peptidase (beta-lactamase class C family)|nr:serine hydrolase domain-containing protein [Anaerolineaceae bacterium]